MTAEGERALAELSAAIGAGGGTPLAEALDGAREAAVRGSLTAAEVEETMLQAYLFVGFPGVLAAFTAWRERVPGGAATGAPEDPLAWLGREGDREARGEDVCRRVYGPAYERLRENVRQLHPDLDRWMIREGYGKVLGRPGLDLEVRELCIVALLAAAGRAPQLHSHLRGALRSGAGEGRIRAALEAGLSRLPGEDERRRLEELWERVVRSPRGTQVSGSPARDI